MKKYRLQFKYSDGGIWNCQRRITPLPSLYPFWGFYDSAHGKPDLFDKCEMDRILFKQPYISSGDFVVEIVDE